MNITVIGASAGIGLLAVEKALESGHDVIALSRNTNALPDHPRLKKINGSSTSKETLLKATQHTDAIVITIGTKQKKGTTLFSDTANALIGISGHLRADIPILWVSGFGVGNSKPFLNFFMKMVIRLFLRDQYEDKTRMEKIMEESKLKWEFIRPGILTDGPESGYEVITSLFKSMKVGKISRKDVAGLLIKEAEQPTMLFQYPVPVSRK